MHTLEVCGLSQDIRLPPLRNYITSTSHKGLARGRKTLVLVQLSPGISSEDSMQLETAPAAPESVCAQAHVPSCSISLMCGYKHSQIHKYLPFVVLLYQCRGRNSLGAHDHRSLQSASLLWHTAAAVPQDPWAFSLTCLDTITLTHPAKVLQKLVGELSPWSLKGPLEV